MQKETFSKGLKIFLAGAALGAAAGGSLAMKDTVQSYLSDRPAECSGHPVEFRGRKYALPLEKGRTVSLGDGVTYVSPPRGIGYIHVAKILGYPDPECFGNAMKEYNERHGRKGLRGDDVIIVPEKPAVRQAETLKPSRARPDQP